MSVEWPWHVLGLSEACDERAVKRAYASTLKRIDRDDPLQFQELRSAYEAAINIASNQTSTSVFWGPDQEDLGQEGGSDIHAEDGCKFPTFHEITSKNVEHSIFDGEETFWEHEYHSEPSVDHEAFRKFNATGDVNELFSRHEGKFRQVEEATFCFLSDALDRGEDISKYARVLDFCESYFKWISDFNSCSKKFGARLNFDDVWNEVEGVFRFVKMDFDKIHYQPVRYKKFNYFLVLLSLFQGGVMFYFIDGIKGQGSFIFGPLILLPLGLFFNFAVYLLMRSVLEIFAFFSDFFVEKLVRVGGGLFVLMQKYGIGFAISLVSTKFQAYVLTCVFSTAITVSGIVVRLVRYLTA
ncbi:hypothetical protein [Thalassospira lucentensis]|uniref:hypothetical protein n=1 Tax=Thalassospira lucentensis TaxID=168935 RepID=UPI003AA87B3E